MASGEDLAISDAALWMLLLLRLTAVTTDERLELRNSKLNLKIPAGNLLTPHRCHSDSSPNF